VDNDDDGDDGDDGDDDEWRVIQGYKMR